MRFTLSILVCLLGLLIAALASAQTPIDPANNFAWSENAGWLNFNSTHDGVTVYADHVEGYAWAENIGWIKLGSYSGGGSHTYTNTNSTNWASTTAAAACPAMPGARMRAGSTSIRRTVR